MTVDEQCARLRANIAKLIGRGPMRPVYRLRGAMVTRYFQRVPPRGVWWERAVRSLCEDILDAFEMWEAKPAFDRLERQARELDAMIEELQALRREFKLPGLKDGE